MKNLKRIWNSESKIYSLGGLSIRKGVPARAPYYFILSLLIMILLDTIPISPFYWIHVFVGDIFAWCLNYIIMTAALTAVLTYSHQYRKGKTLEQKVITQWKSLRSAKRMSLYEPMPKRTVVQFGTVVTYRDCPRKENANETSAN
jgi:hypothetical protein